jgi:hypothetical protein
MSSLTAAEALDMLLLCSTSTFPSVLDSISASKPDYREDLPLGPARARAVYFRCGQHPHLSDVKMAVILLK